MTPDTIMIFAAGHGTRMGALTNDRPKPMIPVAGRTLIDRALDLADAASIANRVVNTHYLGHLLADHLHQRPGVTLSPEAGEALETGGGLKQALPLLGPDPVFTLNPDAVFAGINPLNLLAQHWHPTGFEALLLLVPLARARGFLGRGDFSMDAKGRLSRYSGGPGPVYVNTGAQIVRTDRYRAEPQAKFSQNLIWDRMIADGGLFGCVYPGGWADVGTPEGIGLAEAMLQGDPDV